MGDPGIRLLQQVEDSEICIISNDQCEAFPVHSNLQSRLASNMFNNIIIMMLMA